jgi:hypothetical protein
MNLDNLRLMEQVQSIIKEEELINTDRNSIAEFEMLE